MKEGTPLVGTHTPGRLRMLNEALHLLISVHKVSCCVNDRPPLLLLLRSMRFQSILCVFEYTNNRVRIVTENERKRSG